MTGLGATVQSRLPEQASARSREGGGVFKLRRRGEEESRATQKVRAGEGRPRAGEERRQTRRAVKPHCDLGRAAGLVTTRYILPPLLIGDFQGIWYFWLPSPGAYWFVDRAVLIVLSLFDLWRPTHSME
ncbi:predicted protein [Histoplasma capsulatum G186AR]|uniref:Uncharacterized protein n=1 Tax=Ajellomyces capsulatus (strain G186AR / H82 / ATCC MYA-2454 / RMSCC 2432) TaxID=447093 RepID=C0NHA7_AJECG|nr:uncharacterized protein HCBG_02729 [Histoplasma capsulatum G186AR]EEH09192.1 predicted protein [Histoplasma capsulatum G186AR]